MLLTLVHLVARLTGSLCNLTLVPQPATTAALLNFSPRTNRANSIILLASFFFISFSHHFSLANWELRVATSLSWKVHGLSQCKTPCFPLTQSVRRARGARAQRSRRFRRRRAGTPIRGSADRSCRGGSANRFNYYSIFFVFSPIFLRRVIINSDGHGRGDVRRGRGHSGAPLRARPRRHHRGRLQAQLLTPDSTTRAASPPPDERALMRGRLAVLLLLAATAAAAAAAAAAAHSESSCPFHDIGGHGEPHDHHGHGHSCGGGDHGHNHHHHHHGDGHGHDHGEIQRLLPEEMAEEADLELESFGYEEHDHGHHNHHHGHHHGHGHGDMEPETSPMGVWLSAMGCSLLVSMASLVCLILLPVIFFQGKPSKAMVDSLAVFGAGAMLGDSFLHQLPHAFGGGHSHSHDHDGHNHAHAREHAHAHSLEDLSVGLSILFGIVLFFIVEKIVRYVEDNSHGAHSMGHGHPHHHHKRHDTSDKAEEKSSVNGAVGKIDDGNRNESKATVRKRSSSASSIAADGETVNSKSDPTNDKALSNEGSSVSNSNLVFGYLNLFSDGVHNFTDGMALGSAFLLHGSVGGWSRTLFLLAHELPQEVGDFGILVRSGFTVSKALFFNFLSALVALAGTALALSLGKDPGHSSLIEGFTAGGFIYIAVAGVLPQMNDQKTTFKNSVAQLISLTMGMLVALGISLVE